MDIKEIFLDLTSHTTPQGFEDTLEEYLPKNYKNDHVGNYYVQVGTDPTVMFTSHLDNKCDEVFDVVHSFKNNIIRTDGYSILGADDKAGVTLMLDMIDKDIHGLYYFFIGEENGRVGSKNLSNYLSKNKDRLFTYVEKVISFDRMGYDDIVCEQLGQKSCSFEFATELSIQLNQFDLSYKPTKEGSYSDSYSFVGLYPECTNLSVGYFDEHLETEYQDIEFLEKISNVFVEIDWDSLPVVRTV